MAMNENKNPHQDLVILVERILKFLKFMIVDPTIEIYRGFALEIELNLKPPIRYDKASNYFDMFDSKIDVVFWLCGNLSIIRWIVQRQQNAKLHRSDIHHFLLTEDFRVHGWNACARAGKFRGKTIHEICLVNAYEMPGKRVVNPYEIKDSEILFPTRKSPTKKIA